MNNSEPEVFEHIKTMVAEWVDGSDLSKSFESDFLVAATWTITCSPPHASIEELAIATMDLHLWFLYLDDYGGSDYADLYQGLSRVISGLEFVGSDESEVRRVLKQFSDHIQRLAQRGLPMTRYIDERKTALATYERRNRNNEVGAMPSFAELLELREITTLFRLWYTLWEILDGFQITREEYESQIFDRAIAATTRWHVFINDLHSLPRDTKTGMPNLVSCLERDRGMSREDSVAFILGQCDQQVLALETAWQEARACGLGVGNLGRAFEFLHLNIEGGRELYRRDLERYRPPAAR
jgi:Terpene synthase family 2, C-terminal metal binding